jgi:hypothetical protein
VSALGRKSLWIGSETGEAEIWVHPFKLASDFQLDFRIADYDDPVRGADVAQTVEVRPELLTITYSHATFTVHQHILVPLDEPGLLVLLEVETLRSLEVLVSFRTVFQYAWPAAFGGQYAFWKEDEKAFVLSESLQERNAVIGSPWASSATSHPAHAVPDAPSRFIIPVDVERASKELIPIGVAAGTAPREEVFSIYRRIMSEAEQLYEKKRQHVSELRNTTTIIDTPDDTLDLALAWSTINLDEALSCNPDLGCGLVAGWGPSGTGTRPGFGWYFAGDASVNSLAMDSLGLWPQVAEGLRFTAQYQRSDGKIPHEISQAAKRILWFEEFPYAYYHAETTPYWIASVWRYWRASGDGELVRELWPVVEKAYRWCLTTETDGDGLMENKSRGLGHIELGELREGIHQDIYLAALWIEALRAIQELARFMDMDTMAEEAEELHDRASQTLNERYWREGEGYHAFGILQSGETNDNLTVWPSTAAAFGLLDASRAKRTLTHLAADKISSSWGAHILSAESPLYDPMHYNNGAVWPFVTGFVVWGQYRYRRPWAAFPLLDALGQMTFDWARGRHPELLSGGFYRPLDTAVPQQFFATSMLVTSVVQGMLGWEPDAPRARARIAPQIPPHWASVAVSNLRLAGTSLSLDIEQQSEKTTVVLTGDGGDASLEVNLPIPPGARSVTIEPSGKLDSVGGKVTTEVGVSSRPRRVEARWTGGLRIEPPLVNLMPGQESTGLRILDFQYSEDAWLLDLEGPAGRRLELRLHGESFSKVDGARLVGREGSTSAIVVDFAGTEGRVTKRVRIER